MSQEATAEPSPVAGRVVKKFPGRPVGAVNNTTRELREMFTRVAVDGGREFWAWLQSIPDPHKRCDIYLKACEYAAPKLGRVEITGAEGGPVQHTYRWLDEGETVEGEVIGKEF